MKANDFIREHGLEKVRSIINKYLNYAHSTDDACMFVNEHDCIEHIKKDLHTCVRFDDLKILIESHDLVYEHSSLRQAKKYAESEYTAPEIREMLLKAIADVESCQ